ncbi:SDR family NAD(P)-dependent oxidoreductase [Saccharopolyspora phatthalungensis]|uniref:NAD(P)-dependent dehydrogenase (Short-subunit alcohol dehydrogenase family) n=1 Tax=Saccharopolyspora phatthalungensis TaxID=664693 RepID=A0A840QGN1_9PSEU|nr:SDR family NAD(P)-dependent oxidoreductase [Saccharopolyspora phatthalungensis]MBB5159120.1 NAD(P)-dependent dehydrogenase (short-subunit alcohol dehydrogenase family) [Saccharopolyspora phatthalungensis]
MRDNADLRSGTAVITGAASKRGIGRALAGRLAASGWRLGLLDIDLEVEKVAAALGAEHDVAAMGAVADIADPESVDAAVSGFEAELPPITAIVNIAGISAPTSLLDADFATWERVMRINATGTFVTCKRIVPGLVERGYGRVVNLGSTAMQNGGGTYSKSTYAASKAAIEGFSRALALEVAPSGVTVNVVAPATIDTDIMGGRITDERKPAFLAQLPVGRLGTTREVAALIEFLIGEEAGYITGATYNINGGLRIG